MDYVDIKDAGQVCPITFCPDLAVEIHNTTFSFTNSSVSNSMVVGLRIDDDAQLEAFSNNRFFGNALVGLSIEAAMVPQLDVASDYYGLEAANGLPYISATGDLSRNGTFNWKALNAAYRIRRLDLEFGTLVLEPGVELVMDEGGNIEVTDGGVLKSMGTATDPVIIHGRVASPGYWNGIKIEETDSNAHVLQHTIISHSGEVSGLQNFVAAVWVDEAEVTFINSTFSDNAGYGIRCSDQEFPREASVVVDGGGNQFSNNERGAVSNNCDVR